MSYWQAVVLGSVILLYFKVMALVRQHRRMKQENRRLRLLVSSIQSGAFVF
jgi:hypothetical protein